MAKPKPDNSKIGEVLALAVVIGDKAAAKQFGISLRTLQRYRLQGGDDPIVSHCVATKKAELHASLVPWYEQAESFLSLAVTKMTELVQAASPEQLRDVVGAFKVVGEMIETRSALNVASSSPAGEASAEIEGRDAAGAKSPAGKTSRHSVSIN